MLEKKKIETILFETKGLTFFERFGINQRMWLTMRLFSCFRVVGGGISSIALIFEGSIPFRWTTNPKNVPAETPKAHFSGFIFILFARHLSKTRSNTAM